MRDGSRLAMAYHSLVVKWTIRSLTELQRVSGVDLHRELVFEYGWEVTVSWRGIQMLSSSLKEVPSYRSGGMPKTCWRIDEHNIIQ